MPKELKYIAQQAQDDFIQDYAGNTTFFTLEDWVQRCGSVLGEYYLNEFKAQYAELRQEKRDEVVGFSTDVLSELSLTFEGGQGEWTSKEKVNAFSFAYDKQNSGYQNVFITKPAPRKEAIRTSINELWQLEYSGTVNRIFWYPEGGKIKAVSKGFCNLQEAILYYVPSIEEDMMVPDGVIDYVRRTAVQNMMIAAQQIVKETNNGNRNKTMETEIDKQQLNPQR